MRLDPLKLHLPPWQPSTSRISRRNHATIQNSAPIYHYHHLTLGSLSFFIEAQSIRGMR